MYTSDAHTHTHTHTHTQWLVVTCFSKGRMYVKEELSLYVPAGVFAKVGLIPSTQTGRETVVRFSFSHTLSVSGSHATC